MIRRSATASRVLGLLLAAAASLGAQPRSLHWAELAVTARLDADGVLHVTEDHHMVMTGDWNGGERIFDIRPGQELELERVSRGDASASRADGSPSRWRELSRGSLSSVDQWNWHGDTTVRWRSRRPSDPPFAETDLHYRLEYRLGGILRETDDGYRLDHDFSFPDRIGRIERYVLELEIDPVWRVDPPIETRVVRENVPSGVGFVVTRQLEYTGAGEPAAAIQRPSAWTYAVPGVLATLWICVLWWRLRRSDRRLGRDPMVRVPDRVGEEELAQLLLSWLPEEAGALWDQKVGAAEVAAVIARLVADGKLESEVEERGLLKRKVLKLTRRVERSAFEGYEEDLIRKLFYGDRRSVDTEQLRKHYKKKGFDPASLIRKDIERNVERRIEDATGESDRGLKPSMKRTSRLVLLSFGLIALDLFLRRRVLFIDRGDATDANIVWLVVLVPVLLLVYLPAVGIATAARKRVEGAWRWRWALLPAALLMLAVALAPGLLFPFSVTTRAGLLGVCGIVAFVLALASSVMNQAQCRLTAGGVAIRRRLLAIRKWLAAELSKERPALHDAWFPYFLALGLERQVDSWFSAYGQRAARGVRTSTLGGGSGGSLAPSWTGGGGSFGGAGATASWAAAASGMAAGVAKASSGGGSSGGGGGGGSSGGGGGGGW